jgi:ubiquinol-cytochrome c reductase subunit 7
MLKATRPNQVQQHFAGMRYTIAHFFYPNMYREFLSVQNAHKVERGARLTTALKANKVDIRSLLALPVVDSAHPYRMEYPWEKVVAVMDPKALTFYGSWYRAKTLAFYENLMLHKFGLMSDDMIQVRGWWARAARTRMPQRTLIDADRRVMRGRVLKDKYLFDKKTKWVQPVDNVPYMGPYVMMVADEWEEKWGFFAGQEVEY